MIDLRSVWSAMTTTKSELDRFSNERFDEACEKREKPGT
jgi:hypothetical protein